MATSETTRGYGPAIKLFGRTISVASEQQVEELRDGGTELRMMTARSWIKDKDSCQEAKPQDAIPAPHHTLATGDNTCAPKDTSKNTHHQLLPATEHRHPETKNGIPPPTTRTKALPCPRCSSQDTKFCYYNNYNINQPRYLCKDCRRYWTVGGATRDVPPAAAGSRKRNTTGRQYSSSTYDHHSDSDSTEFTAEGPSSCSTEPTLTEPISTSSSATTTTGTDMWSYGFSSEGRVAAVQGAPAGPFPWAPRWNNMNATVMADSCVCTSGMVYRQIGGGISSNNTSTAASRSLGLFAWSQMVPIMTTAVFAVPVAPVVCNPSFQTSFGLWNSTPWLPPAYGGQFSGNLSCTSRVEECTAESVTMCVRKKPRVVRDP